MKTVLEICCATLYDVQAAAKAGADRLELNSAFYLGGLTPSMGVVRLAKKTCNLPMVAMVRPRGGGFCYTEEEYATMLSDGEILLQEGMDGIVFGFLTPDKRVDVEKTKALTELAHRYGKEAVFHKAFDCIEDQEQALKELIAIGMDRVLTSGGGKAALDRADHLAYLIKTYGKDITLLLGGGIRAGNVETLIRATGATEIHTACAGFLEDDTVMGNAVSYAYRQDNTPERYEAVDPAQVTQIRQILDNM